MVESQRDPSIRKCVQVHAGEKAEAMMKDEYWMEIQHDLHIIGLALVMCFMYQKDNRLALIVINVK